MPVDFELRPTVADDWREVRALRLEMLADTPEAFLEHLADAERHDEATWRTRAARGYMVAILPNGRWVGTMGVHQGAADLTPFLVGVYLSPDVRGARYGIADALLAAVEHQASATADRILLEVHEDNARARAFYGRHGYVETGRSRAYPLDTTKRELEMLKRLR